jgi:putative flavoprotein involved in K+ transport
MTEQITEIDTLVVGAGQAGVAMSEHLTQHGIPHLVLEKTHREAWRSGRWDSLVANGPAWHDRFPGMTFADCDADSFVAKEQIADYFAAYAKTFNAPIKTGVEVFSAERLSGRPAFAWKPRWA